MIQLLVRRDMSHPEFWLGAEVSSKSAVSVGWAATMSVAALVSVSELPASSVKLTLACTRCPRWCN